MKNNFNSNHVMINTHQVGNKQRHSYSINAPNFLSHEEIEEENLSDLGIHEDTEEYDDDIFE